MADRTPSNLVLLDHWENTIDALCIDIYQTLAKMLDKLGFKPTTPGLTAFVSTDRVTGARLIPYSSPNLFP